MLYLSKKEMSDIILHVIFITTFVAIFFFTYVTDVEKKLVNDQIVMLVHNMFYDAGILDVNTKSQIKTLLENNQNLSVTNPDLSEEDEKTKKNNDKIYQNVIKILIISVITGLVMSYGLFYYDENPNKGNYMKIIKKNSVLLVSVAIIEYLFLHLVLSNYYYADPNFVKKQILLALQKHSQ